MRMTAGADLHGWDALLRVAKDSHIPACMCTYSQSSSVVPQLMRAWPVKGAAGMVYFSARLSTKSHVLHLTPIR